MVSYKISDIKSFMTSLLLRSVFDSFLVAQSHVVTCNKFSILGKLNRDWYQDDEWEALNGRSYALWKDVKPVLFDLIKGNKTPSSMKIIFLLSADKQKELVERSGNHLKTEDVEGLFLTIHYEKKQLRLITGSSIKIFTMDHKLDLIWDEWVEFFLREQQIPIEYM